MSSDIPEEPKDRLSLYDIRVLLNDTQDGFLAMTKGYMNKNNIAHIPKELIVKSFLNFFIMSHPEYFPKKAEEKKEEKKLIITL